MSMWEPMEMSRADGLMDAGPACLTLPAISVGLSHRIENGGGKSGIR